LVLELVSRVNSTDASGGEVERIACLWNYDTQQYDRIAVDPTDPSGPFAKARFRVEPASIPSYLRGPLWYLFEWKEKADEEGLFSSVDIDQITVTVR
jgi:hypothetical protein